MRQQSLLSFSGQNTANQQNAKPQTNQFVQRGQNLSSHRHMAQFYQNTNNQEVKEVKMKEIDQINQAQQPNQSKSNNIDANFFNNVATMSSINRQKLLTLTCQCEVERNGYPDMLVKKKDKNKVLQLFKVQGEKDGIYIDELRIFIKFQKTMDIAIDFSLKDIKKVISLQANQGKITFELSLIEKPNSKSKQEENLGRSLLQSASVPSKIKVFLGGMEPNLAESLIKKLQEEYTNSQNQKQIDSKQPQDQQISTIQHQKMNKININQQINQNNHIQKLQMGQNLPGSQKRKLDQISNPSTISVNPRAKVIRLNDQPVQQIQNVQKQEPQLIQIKSKPNISLKQLPWDMLRLIMNSLSALDYKILKNVDKQFNKLIVDKRIKLAFNKKEVTERIFFNLLDKSKLIKHLTFGENFKNITVRSLQDHLITIPSLQVIDMINFVNINDQTLARLVNSCRKSLHTFRISYASQGIGIPSMLALSKCENLKDLQLGEITIQHNDKIIGGGNLGYERLGIVKKMFQIKKFSLEKLVIYQCDQTILNYLFESKEKDTLAKLCIGEFVQRNMIKLEEIDNLKKFKNLNFLNLCGTYYPLQFEIFMSDEQNDQLLSVAGCRELELTFFGLKNNLRYLVIGEYAYDELLNFIAEMCKNLEMFEINSTQITDQGLIPILRKLSKLRTLDISSCTLITGICFFEAQEFAITNLQRFVTRLQGFEQQKVKEKLKEIVPNCQLELKLNKKYF